MPILPLEIIETIITILAEDDPSLSSIKACALVCHDFLPLCRKYIFASITLNDDDSRPRPSPPFPWITKATTRMLRRLLDTTPEIADYIRNLKYSISSEDSDAVAVAQTFGKITHLKYLFVARTRSRKFVWNNNPLRPALLHLLHLPTLVHFRISQVQDFLVLDLAPCINLEHLQFGYLQLFEVNDAVALNQPDSSIRIHRISAEDNGPTTLKKMCTVQRADGMPFIDISSLTDLLLDIWIQRPGDIEASHYLFTRCTNLIRACIRITVDEGTTWTRIGLSNMLHLSVRTLKHLCMETSQTATYDPLAGLYTEIEAIENHNVIETITIQVNFQTDCNLVVGDEWDRLDKALAHSGWPNLRKVSLTITIWDWSYEKANHELGCALRELPQAQFPKLSSSKSLSFELAIRERHKDYI